MDQYKSELRQIDDLLIQYEGMICKIENKKRKLRNKRKLILSKIRKQEIEEIKALNLTTVFQAVVPPISEILNKEPQKYDPNRLMLENKITHMITHSLVKVLCELLDIKVLKYTINEFMISLRELDIKYTDDIYRLLKLATTIEKNRQELYERINSIEFKYMYDYNAIFDVVIEQPNIITKEYIVNRKYKQYLYPEDTIKSIHKHNKVFIYIRDQTSIYLDISRITDQLNITIEDLVSAIFIGHFHAN